MEKISEQFNALNEPFKELFVCVMAYQNESLKKDIMKHEKWTEELFLGKLGDSLDMICKDVTTSTKQQMLVDILKMLDTLTMEICSYIYDITTENVKVFAPRSVSCFWLHENYAMVNTTCQVGMYLSHGSQNIPSALLRIHDICYRYDTIIREPMEKYYENLEETTRKRDPSYINLKERKN